MDNKSSLSVAHDARDRYLLAASLAAGLYRNQCPKTHKPDAQDEYDWRMRVCCCEGCRKQKTDATAEHSRTDIFRFDAPQCLRESDSYTNADQATAEGSDKEPRMANRRAEQRSKNSRNACPTVTGRIKRDHPGSKMVPFGDSKSPTWGFSLVFRHHCS